MTDYAPIIAEAAVGRFRDMLIEKPGLLEMPPEEAIDSFILGTAVEFGAQIVNVFPNVTAEEAKRGMAIARAFQPEELEAFRLEVDAEKSRPLKRLLVQISGWAAGLAR